MKLSDFSYCELLALSNTISIAIRGNFSNDEIAILSSFFAILGDNLALSLSVDN